MPAAPITITAKVLRACVLAAARSGVAPEALLPLGADPAVLDDGDAHVPIAWVLRAWTDAPALTGDPAFGLHAAEMMAATRAHVVDYAIAHCHTPREILETIVRYQRLLMSRADLRLTVAGRVAIFSHPREAVPFTRPPQLDDFIVAQWALALRERCSPGFPLRRVQFDHAAPASTDEHARIFQCPVSFGAAPDAIEFDAALLDVQLERPDATLLTMLRRHADALLADASNASNLPGAPAAPAAPAAPDVPDVAGAPDASSTTGAAARVTALRRHLVENAAGTEITIQQAARALGASPRSLQRQLREAGTSFSEVASDARRDLALRCLRDSNYSVSEVAFLVGFSEVSAFSRAVRRWTGGSPLEWRRANPAGAPGTHSGARGTNSGAPG